MIWFLGLAGIDRDHRHVEHVSRIPQSDYARERTNVAVVPSVDCLEAFLSWLAFQVLMLVLSLATLTVQTA